MSINKKRTLDGNIKSKSSVKVSENSEVYVSLLRGVNVGGGNRISKDQLISAFDSVGCQNIVTYIQSGNIIFSSNMKKMELVESIHTALINKYQLNVEVFVFDQIEWYSMLNFMKKHSVPVEGEGVVKVYKGKTIKVVTDYITILKINADVTDVKDRQIKINNKKDKVLEKLQNYGVSNAIEFINSKPIAHERDGFCLFDTTISAPYIILYTYAPQGVLETKFNNSQFEKEFKKNDTCATTRNLNTTLKIYEIMTSIRLKCENKTNQ